MKELKLSTQAVGALMMALQQSLLEQSDIVPVLKEFKLKLSEDGLVVLNPPIVRFNKNTTQDLVQANEGKDEGIAVE